MKKILLVQPHCFYKLPGGSYRDAAIITREWFAVEKVWKHSAGRRRKVYAEQ
jgi:hypothetical protein